jgi:hypothetical protein
MGAFFATLGSALSESGELVRWRVRIEQHIQPPTPGQLRILEDFGGFSNRVGDPSPQFVYPLAGSNASRQYMSAHLAELGGKIGAPVSLTILDEV